MEQNLFSRYPITKIFKQNQLPKPESVVLLNYWILITIKVTTEDASNFVVRLERSDKGIVANEAKVISLLNKKSDLPLPRLLVCDISKKIYDFDYAIYDWISGTVEKHFKFTTEQELNLNFEMGRLLKKLHSFSSKNLAEFLDSPIPCENWRHYLLGKSLSGIEHLKEVINKEISSKIREILSRYSKLIPLNVKPAILHRDFKFRNMLIAEGSQCDTLSNDGCCQYYIKGIIDFECSMVGDPILDVASSGVCLFDNLSKNAFLDGYFGTEHKPAFLFESLYIYSIINEIDIMERAPQGSNLNESLLLLENFVNEIKKWSFQKEIEMIVSHIEEKKTNGGVIVVASGCFDLLHIGHIRHLQAAKALGDFLIVLISDDASVRLMKGKNRPIIPEYQRAEIIRAISAVDEVIIHSKDQLLPIVNKIHPDIFVKGQEYGDISNEIRNVVGKIMNVGGQLAISTTYMIERCQFRQGTGNYSNSTFIQRIKNVFKLLL